MILLQNTASTLAMISSLGVEIEPQDTIQLDLMFTNNQLINTPDLDQPNFVFTFNGQVVSYDKLIENITDLTAYTHDQRDTLAHELDKNSFFVYTQAPNVTTISYYTDSTMSVLLKQDIVTKVNGRVATVVTNLYDGAVIVETFTEVISRNADLTVKNIVSTDVRP